MPHNIEYLIDGSRAFVTLDRPEKHNGVTIEMMRELIRVGNDIRKHREIRAVVISGNGASFCSGLDIAKAAKDPVAAVLSFLPIPWLGTNTFQECCWVWRRLPVPVIASIHGNCFGAGLQLALAADFRFATPDAEFSVMEARYGLVPDMTGAQTLAELVGVDTAKLLTMTADVIDGADAKALGLVTGLAADPRAAAIELADRIETRSPDAVAGAKKMFTDTWTSSARQTFAVERLTQLRMLLGANAAIARKAGLARQTPEFEPRQLR